MDQKLLPETFVEPTDALVAGFDVIDFPHGLTDRMVQLLDVSATGLPDRILEPGDLRLARVGGRSGASPARRWRGIRRAVARSWSAARLPGGSVPGCLDAAGEGVEAEGEPLVAVAGPTVDGSPRSSRMRVRAAWLMYRFDWRVCTFSAITSGPNVLGDTGSRWRLSSCR
jgi:hypothetical protein